jgi:hypothetical protein
MGITTKPDKQKEKALILLCYLFCPNTLWPPDTSHMAIGWYSWIQWPVYNVLESLQRFQDCQRLF